MICRRSFLSGLLLALPGSARAQSSPPTIGLIVPGTIASHGKWVAAFERRMRELGWIDGRTVRIDYRWTEGQSERASDFAADPVQRKVDVIVTSGSVTVAAAKRATSTIPIVSPRRVIRSGPGL